MQRVLTGRFLRILSHSQRKIKMFAKALEEK